MAVNYNDSRFQTVEQEKKQALNNVNNMYNNMISQNDKFYKDQVNLVKDYETTQKEIQQQQTDFTIEKINQQKDQAKQDYTKEQKASYVDYKKATDEYGANAEALASRGLNYSGYAESNRVSMYNTYQNRYATAREVYNRAVLNYDNGIKEAQLANNSALAEISFKSMQQQLELALEGFQYKNTLLQAQLNARNETEDRYYNRWHDVLEQINTENALAEQMRQFNANLALERDQFNWQKQQAAIENSFAERQVKAQEKAAKNSSYSSGGGGTSKATGGSSAKGSGSGGGGFRGTSNKKTATNNKKASSSGKWMSAREVANSLGLPAAVDLSKVISTKEYEVKTVDGFKYYRKK